MRETRRFDSARIRTRPFPKRLPARSATRATSSTTDAVNHTSVPLRSGDSCRHGTDRSVGYVMSVPKEYRYAEAMVCLGRVPGLVPVGARKDERTGKHFGNYS